MNDLVTLIKKARFVFVCGNGGSGANAEHMTNDLFSKGIRAICLNSNASIITMIANDFGYEHIFSKQLEIYGSKEDLLITISCSGTSPNIENAKRTAFVKIGMAFYTFETFGKETDYGKLEDKHLQFSHEIKKLL